MPYRRRRRNKTNRLVSGSVRFEKGSRPEGAGEEVVVEGVVGGMEVDVGERIEVVAGYGLGCGFEGVPLVEGEGAAEG